MLSRSRSVASFLALLVLATAAPAAWAATPEDDRPARFGEAWERPGAADDARLIVTLRPGATGAAVDRLARGGREVVSVDRGRARAVVRAATVDLDTARRQLEADPAVETVSVSRRLYRDADPTGEEFWSELWGLHNSGQTILEHYPDYATMGIADMDTNTLQAQRVSTGSGVVVAVIDDGVDFSQPDLATQAWTNPGEWGDDALDNGADRQDNGIDDDANGYVDDVHGWDFCHDDNTVHDPDDDYHGTHVAGTIGAALNGSGVVGVAPDVRIMALKFLGDDPGCGFDDQAIAAIEYAASFDVAISNNSWGRPANGASALENQALYDAIQASGMLFIASAGNAATNNDTSASRSVPASFNLPNILSVAAIDNRGALADFSNYGATTVDIAAPGVDVLSTFPEYHGAAGDAEAGHVYLSGTSMAAPHVAGIAALVGSQTPSLLTTPTALKSRVMTASKARGGTTGKTITGRLADGAYALDLVAPTAQPPSRHGFVAGTTIGTTTVPTRVKWTAGADALSGIGSYAVRQSVNGGAWSTVIASTTALQLDRSLTVNATSRFQVRARDRAGNTGAFVDGPLIRATLTQQTSGALSYSGTWTSSAASGASGGSTRYATRSGASVSLTFTGRSIAVVAPRSSTRGSVRIYLDGTYVGTFSTYRSTAQSRYVLYARDWGSVATHTIKLVVAGTAGRPRFDLDAFAVLK